MRDELKWEDVDLGVRELVESLIKAFESDRQASLRLVACNLDSISCSALVRDRLRHLPGLTTLDIWGNKIGDAGAASLAEGLPGLTTLDISGNGIGDAGAASLAGGLPDLTTLHISGNGIGEAGAASLAEGLPGLTTLDISFNGIGEAGAASLAGGLPKLATLHISENRIRRRRRGVACRGPAGPDDA